MFKREVRDEKERLYQSTIRLKELTFDKNIPYEQAQKIREVQDKNYKKWYFMHMLAKHEDKIKKM